MSGQSPASAVSRGTVSKGTPTRAGSASAVSKGTVSKGTRTKASSASGASRGTVSKGTRTNATTDEHKHKAHEPTRRVDAARTAVGGSKRRLVPGSRRIGAPPHDEWAEVTVIVRPRSSVPFPSVEELGRQPLAERRHVDLRAFVGVLRRRSEGSRGGGGVRARLPAARSSSRAWLAVASRSKGRWPRWRPRSAPSSRGTTRRRVSTAAVRGPFTFLAELAPDRRGCARPGRPAAGPSTDPSPVGRRASTRTRPDRSRRPRLPGCTTSRPSSTGGDNGSPSSSSAAATGGRSCASTSPTSVSSCRRSRRSPSTECRTGPACMPMPTAR